MFWNQGARSAIRCAMTFGWKFVFMCIPAPQHASNSAEEESKRRSAELILPGHLAVAPKR
jgi:hypothetical protein